MLEGREVDLRDLDLDELQRQADENGETASIKAIKLDDWEVFGLVHDSFGTESPRDNQGRNIAMHAAIVGSIDRYREFADSE